MFLERAYCNCVILFTLNSHSCILSDPRLVDFVRSRKAQRTKGSETSSSPVQRKDFLKESPANSASPDIEDTGKAQESTMEENEDEEDSQLVVHPPISGK